jgi:hypothetical protein
MLFSYKRTKKFIYLFKKVLFSLKEHIKNLLNFLIISDSNKSLINLVKLKVSF